MMKNTFYFISKAHVNFCLEFLVILIRKIWLISKFMSSQPEKQTTTIHIFPNISRSNDNQRMKFDQLIEHNRINIFLHKSYKK